MVQLFDMSAERFKQDESTNYKIVLSLGPVHEFVCISVRTGNLNCFRVK